MVVEVQLFATLRDRLPGHDPRNPEPVELDEGSTVEALLAQLGLADQPVLAFVGRRKAPPDRVLEPGDRVGLFPPMVGG